MPPTSLPPSLSTSPRFPVSGPETGELSYITRRSFESEPSLSDALGGAFDSHSQYQFAARFNLSILELSC
ncbi:hypothetical protein SCP_1100640 [Sparassis crispa]|uniref:Uncharacterized protein n=1 Tax=Sparassis crispa TaxID=139825 RepID=A0A401GZ08_9APHY|nr:hypothetical protein SCP_1100640 [Sparassis crispa]GBE87389.1 hypothetical protein SCP_1100640 [Sparassis crispa]